MLRELNENEMMMVSGGTEDDPIDEVVSTGTIIRDDSYIDPFGYTNSIGFIDGLGISESGYGGSGGSSSSTSDEETTAQPSDSCIPPPAGYNSWAEYTNMLNSYSRNGGAAGDGNAGASAAAGLQDLWNILHDCPEY